MPLFNFLKNLLFSGIVIIFLNIGPGLMILRHRNQKVKYVYSRLILQMSDWSPQPPEKSKTGKILKVKDRHRRRPEYSEGNKNKVDSFTDITSSSIKDKPINSDPWKVLIKTLDTTKGAKEKFGKIEIKSNQISTVDELRCVHFEACGGCSTKGNFSDIPIIRRARNFFGAENIPFPTIVSNHTGWRTHVKLAVRPLSRWSGLKVGLFKQGSHEVEAIPDCQVHHPRINEAVEELRRAASEVGVRGYQEAANGKPAEGELRYIQMSVERETKKVQVVLVWNSMMFKDAEQTLPRLVKRLKGRPDLWHSVYVNFQTSSSNAILNYHPKSWKLLWGPPTLKEKVKIIFMNFM